MPYRVTRTNQRSPGPEGTYDTPEEAIQAVEAWIASQGYVGEEMAIMAGIEIRGPANEVVWLARK